MNDFMDLKRELNTEYDRMEELIRKFEVRFVYQQLIDPRKYLNDLYNYLNTMLLQHEYASFAKNY